MTEKRTSAFSCQRVANLRKMTLALAFMMIVSVMSVGANVGSTQVQHTKAAASSSVTSKKSTFVQQGKAAWYPVAGKISANGQRQKKGGLVAAHRTLPFGTKVLVKCLETGRSVLVTIVDRGPYSKGFVIDMSKDAAKVLGLLDKGKGVTRVSLSVVD